MRKPLEDACPDAHFAGVRKGEDLAAHYASADLFLFPSLTETFGNVVPEALASGLAVLSYDCAAAKELIVSGHNGVLVDAGDELAFVNASVELALDPDRIARMRAESAMSVAHLGWDAIFDTFVSTLNSVLERHGRQFTLSGEGRPIAALLGAAQERLPHANVGTLR